MGKARAENRAERRHEAVQGLFMRVDAYVPRGGGLPFSKRGLYDHMSDQNKIAILGPDDMGVMVVDFKTAKGQCLTISVPRGETAVLKYLQALMPYGLVIQDGAA
jgi:hypothetical protein